MSRSGDDMNLSRSVFLLPLATTLALGQHSSPALVPPKPDQPDAFARRLYQQVLARPSVGIPYGRNFRIYAPYLSKALLHHMEAASTCAKDFDRQNPVDPKLPMKPPFAWLELGTFTGGDDEDEFHAFHIEGIRPERDGSVQVNLKLTWGMPPVKPWFSDVAAIVRRESGHYVVDDVIYLKAREGDVDWRLTQALASGCNGSHWVGYQDH
jgi:hypothetical protein